MSEKAEPTAERHPRLNPGDWTKKSPYCHSELVSESVPRYEQVSNIGQTLKRSCSTREKRHREKCGFRLVPLLARAVQHDKFSSLRVGFTMADRLSRFHNGLVGLRSAFTMAEILLSLTIIGVVAAITLPSLTGNINERTWNTQRKALYARFSQAIPLMGAINGYADGETFISAGLNKVLKINNVCDSDHLEDCGIPSKITTLNAGIYSVPSPFTLQELNEKFVSYSDSFGSYDQSDVEAVGFETQGGESIMLFYMPNCQAEMGETSDHFVQPKICVNMIYDLNGNKGPNTIGKDMGVMSVLYPSDSNVVMPYPNINDAASGVSHADALKICKQQDDEYRLPTRDELASLFINQNILGIPLTSSWYWTSSVSSSLKAWDQSMVSGRRRTRPKTETAQKVKCVKRF